MEWPIMGVLPPSPSDLVGPLRSLSLHQNLDRGKPLPSLVSQIQLLTLKISHICQEICDIKSTRKPKSNLLWGTNSITSLNKEQKDRNCTQELVSNNSAKENIDGRDGWGGTYSSHSTLCPHEPNNPDSSSHHAPIPSSPNLPPSESILEPPGDLSPSPASKIVALTPSLPM